MNTIENKEVKENFEGYLRQVGWSLIHSGMGVYNLVNNLGIETQVQLIGNKLVIGGRSMFGDTEDRSYSHIEDFAKVCLMLDSCMHQIINKDTFTVSSKETEIFFNIRRIQAGKNTIKVIDTTDRN